MGELFAEELVVLAGNVVGRGAPWGHVQSAGGPCIGVSPDSGLYVISPKNRHYTHQWTRLSCETNLVSSVGRVSSGEGRVISSSEYRVMNSCVDRVRTTVPGCSQRAARASTGPSTNTRAVASGARLTDSSAGAASAADQPTRWACGARTAHRNHILTLDVDT